MKKKENIWQEGNEELDNRCKKFFPIRSILNPNKTNCQNLDLNVNSNQELHNQFGLQPEETLSFGFTFFLINRFA
jgi:hypothetical protein